MRFDPVYVGDFKCNLRRIVDYPNLSGYLRELYQLPGDRGDRRMDHIKRHYYRTHPTINPMRSCPSGRRSTRPRRTGATALAARAPRPTSSRESCCIPAHFRHTLRALGLVGYEHMFAAFEGTVDQQLEREREARRCELACSSRKRAPSNASMEIVREAEDNGDWQAAGCSSSAQWLAQIASSDYRNAERITRTSDALRACRRSTRR